MFGKKNRLIEELQDANRKLTSHVSRLREEANHQATLATRARRDMEAQLSANEKWREGLQSQHDLATKRTELARQLVLNGHCAEYAIMQAETIHPGVK